MLLDVTLQQNKDSLAIQGIMEKGITAVSKSAKPKPEAKPKPKPKITKVIDTGDLAEDFFNNMIS